MKNEDNLYFIVEEIERLGGNESWSFTNNDTPSLNTTFENVSSDDDEGSAPVRTMFRMPADPSCF